MRAPQDALSAVRAEGKSPEHVAAIVAAMLDGGAASVLVTRPIPMLEAPSVTSHRMPWSMSSPE